MVELLFNDELYPKGETSPEDNQRLQQLRDEIAVEKERLQQAETDKHKASSLREETKVKQEPETLIVAPRLSLGARVEINYSNLNQLREEREELISRIIGFKGISYLEIQQLLDQNLDKNTAIIQWYLFKDCFRAFIITCNHNKPQIWSSTAKDFEKLEQYWDLYLNSYRQDKQRWRYELNENNKLQQLAEILNLDQIISLIPKSCKKLILIPHRYLHLLPIHALQLSDGEYLIDKFSDGINYAPSCHLLKNLQETQQKQEKGESLFAIQNPTTDLKFTDIEVETIAAKFNPNHILKHHQATVTAFKQQQNSDRIKNAHWLHFSCHGYFNLENPSKSALQLAGAATDSNTENPESSRTLKVSNDKEIDLEKCLTLENIFELTITNCRLVTLGACESGFTDFKLLPFTIKLKKASEKLKKILNPTFCKPKH